MNARKSTLGKGVIVLLLIVLAAVFLFPLFLAFLNSFKTDQEIARSLLALPEKVDLSNYISAWKRMHYPQAFSNSVFVTVLSVAGLVMIAAPCAYQIARRKSPASKIIFFSMLASMVIPFQVLIVPAIIVARNMGLINKLYGMVIMYWGFLLPLSIFLYHGFIQTSPRELEEASLIDGCGQIRTFIWIVFPLLKPITATIVIINALGVFNDFMLPLMMISSRANQTIPLAVSGFFGAYYNQWNLIMAALVLTIVPIIAFFLLLQKHIIAGLAAGALKG